MNQISSPSPAVAGAESSTPYFNSTSSAAVDDLQHNQSRRSLAPFTLSRKNSMILKQSRNSIAAGTAGMADDEEGDDVLETQEGLESFGLDAGADELGSMLAASDKLMSDDDTEKMIQMLCDFEGGFALMLDRIKESMHSCKDAVNFLKKRASIEEDYGKAMIKLSQTTANQKADSKQGSYGESWKQFLYIHEQVGEIRLKFSQAISAAADDLNTLHKNTERSRKQLKDAGYKHWKAVHDAEMSLEKSKTKYESLSEDWERALLNKDNAADPTLALRKNAMSKSISSPMHMFMQNSNNPTKLQKAEEDARSKASTANENYKQQLLSTNSIRASYFQKHLPRFIRMLKATNDTCDSGLQSQLIKHAQDLESSLMNEATVLSPVDKDKIDQGVVKVLERIANQRDFEQFMFAYFQNQKQLQKNEYQYAPYALSAEASSIAHPKPVFGVDLIAVAERDQTSVPTVVTKLIEAVERFGGLRTPGVYRVSGTSSQIQKLRSLFEKDVEKVNMDEWASEINVLTGTLKLYFRELPDSLLPKAMYKNFIDAAGVDDGRLRLISIHELINQLHDAHYSTLQVLMKHLWNAQLLEHENRMSIQNLSIVWGPTILDSPEINPDPAELKLRSRVIETILLNFEKIFDVDS
ncbi:hypothetical protein HDV05_000208 [Chytridiales sp. JEL 0842]|nr:hypothetical protein HDV05_000208 [Chytridiales sp. JEL 0842]